MRLVRLVLVCSLALGCGGDATGPSDQPRNGRIIYLSYRAGSTASELYSMEPDGSSEIRLTQDPSVDYSDLRVSPDFKRLLFTRIGGTAPGGVHVMNVDGTGLSGPFALGWSYDWHPSGAEVVSVGPGADEYRYTLIVSGLDGSNPRPVTDGQAADLFPRWSPDGTRILFARSQPVDAPQDVYVVNPDGSGLTNLTPDSEGFDGNPAWSPDGQRIAFANDAGVNVMQADGSGRTRISERQYCTRPLLWSPDGKHILCITPGSGNYTVGVAVLNADGSGEVSLGIPTKQMNEPSWSPDSRKIVFWASGPIGADIFVMDADGTNRTQLTHDPISAVHPLWLPGP